MDWTVLETYLGNNQRVRDFLAKASAYDVNRIRYKNPFIPFLRFTVGTGLGSRVN